MSQKNEKKSSRRKYHIVTSLKIDVIEKYYYIQKKNLTENNNSNNNWKSSKLSKSVTENMGVADTMRFGGGMRTLMTWMKSKARWQGKTETVKKGI